MMMVSCSSVFVNRLPRSAVSRPEGVGEALRFRGRRKSTAYNAPGTAISRGAATSAPPAIELMSVFRVMARSSCRHRSALGQRDEVHLLGRGVLERLVKPPCVV